MTSFPFRLSPHAVSLGLVLLLPLLVAVGQEKADSPAKTGPPAKADPPANGTDSAEKKPASRPPPAAPTAYMGRPIAQTMHYLGAEWLVRDSREQEERCSLMLASLGVKRGMRICDMGCGNGFYAVQLAKMVGEKGHIFAVDIQPEMLKMLNERADANGVGNVTPILGAYQNPRLPRASCDLIVMVDVYHEFSHPAEMLAAMKKALAPGGALVFVEFRAEDPEVPIRAEHKMTKAQLELELTANGYRRSSEFERLPWQHMVWYQPADTEETKP